MLYLRIQGFISGIFKKYIERFVLTERYSFRIKSKMRGQLVQIQDDSVVLEKVEGGRIITLASEISRLF